MDLPLPVPRCTACDVALEAPHAGDDEARCRRCGRAFKVECLRVDEASVYRGSRAFAVAPMHDPPPRGMGLRVVRDGDVLQVKVGGPRFLTTRLLTASVAGMAAASIFLVLFAFWFHLSWVQMGAAVVFLAPLLEWVRDRCEGRGEELTVKAGRLEWRRFDGPSFVSDESVPVAAMKSVEVTDTSLHIWLEEGKPIEIGAGLNVPASVRRWLAQRLAERLG